MTNHLIVYLIIVTYPANSRMGKENLTFSYSFLRISHPFLVQSLVILFECVARQTLSYRFIKKNMSLFYVTQCQSLAIFISILLIVFGPLIANSIDENYT
jgi:hypothetical protein